jgi:hypothetical protein
VGNLWLPDAEKLILAGVTGGLMGSGPLKVMIHTTEGGSVDGAIVAYKPYPPHMVASYEANRVVQHIPLDLHSYALKSDDSDNDPLIQVEICGFAGSTNSWPDDKYRWLAKHVLAPIYRLRPFELQGPPQGFHGAGEGIVLASASSRIRFTRAAWQNFGGIVGHQHAPAPDTHWDPGQLNIDLLLTFLRAEVSQPILITNKTPLPGGSTDMTPAQMDAVKQVQHKLNEWGVQPALVEDGDPGPKTVKALGNVLAYASWKMSGGGDTGKLNQLLADIDAATAKARS